jgi:hypothetical protein
MLAISQIVMASWPFCSDTDGESNVSRSGDRALAARMWSETSEAATDEVFPRPCSRVATQGICQAGA